MKPTPEWARRNVQPQGEIGPKPPKNRRAAMNDDTTRREPAADAVEAAAKAIRATADAFFEGPEVDQITSVKSAKQAFERLYLDQARAALQAAAVELEPGIDELLDSVSPKANMWTATDPTGGYAASIRFPMVNGEWVTIPATGPTRMAAIQDAVRQATGAEGERE